MKVYIFKIVLISLLFIVTAIASVSVARAADMFAAPNDQASVIVQYFNRGQSFKFCWRKFDMIKSKFGNEKMCIVNDRGSQEISFNFGRTIAKVGAPEIIVRYNTLDRGFVDKTYPVGLVKSYGGASIINPEDKTDVVNMLINSRDIIVFYHVDGSMDYQMAYYPLPIRGANGEVKTEEVSE